MADDGARILTENRAGVLWVTINRPEVRNAIDTQTWMELDQAVCCADDDPEVSVIAITGAGDRTFASGADIRALAQRKPAECLSAVGQRTLQRLPELSKPVIAAINGDAFGGGCELAMACDLRVAVETVRLGLPELSLGVIPGGGGTQRLVTLVGLGRALELTLTGDPIAAPEAQRIGLVNHVVAQGELIQAVDALAGKLRSRGPVAMRMAKASVHFAASAHIHAGLQFERLAQAYLFTTHDHVEGINAFLEKRKAKFTGE